MLASPPKLIDSHAHLGNKRLAGEIDAVLARAAEAGVEAVIDVGVDLDTSRGARDRAHARPAVFAAAGVHPHEAAAFDDADWPAVAELWSDPRVRAIGETGLDYHYDFSPRDRQRALFARHLTAAGDAGRPVVIHVREAFDDAFELIERHGLPAGGVLHCFTGGPAECERALALGLHISLSGLVTFKNAEAVRAAAATVPDDRILVETDAPYLAPVPHRGRPNEPAYVVETARHVAEVRGTPFETLCALTRENTRRFFGLPAAWAEGLRGSM